MPAGQPRECFFERRRQSPGPERGGSIEGQKFPFVEDSHAVGEEFDFLHGVGGKQQRGVGASQNFRFQEMPEISGRDSVQAARGFIEQQYPRLMEKRADQAEALDGAGRKRARLAVERFAQAEPFAQGFDASGDNSIGEMVQAAKEAEILAAREPRAEALVASGVVADLPPDGRGFARRIVPGERSGAACRQQQRGQDAKQGRFAGSIGPEQSHRLALSDFEENAAQCGRSGRAKRLKISAPAAERRWKPFLQRIQDDRMIRHARIYSLSPDRRQSMRDGALRSPNVTARGNPR